LIHVVALCEGVQQEENENDYPFRQFAKIKTILCLCAKRKFVHKVHDTLMVGHSGEEITKVALNRSLYWLDMK
jgi:hypothetical protein